jgi:subtilisin-like proprotein convertase family protein
LNSTADEVEVMVEDGTVWDIQQISEDTPIPIPDANADGIVSQIEIQPDGIVAEAQVDVEIAHTYIGDLLVTAVCPDGTEVVLHNKTGGGADNLDQSYSVTECNGQPAAGLWQLMVSDHANIDTGELSTWTVKIDLAD